MDTLLIAGGCFWGLQELFRAQPGVIGTSVGYMGGSNEHPTYESHPGHAEALKVDFDSSKTSVDALLDYFFKVHDPTTRDRQGNDVGTSYRSVIFYGNDARQLAARSAIERNQQHWANPIVTTLEPEVPFWSAEDYHQDYLQKNPGGYTCHYERKW